MQHVGKRRIGRRTLIMLRLNTSPARESGLFDSAGGNGKEQLLLCSPVRQPERNAEGLQRRKLSGVHRIRVDNTGVNRDLHVAHADFVLEDDSLRIQYG